MSINLSDVANPELEGDVPNNSVNDIIEQYILEIG